MSNILCGKSRVVRKLYYTGTPTRHVNALIKIDDKVYDDSDA